MRASKNLPVFQWNGTANTARVRAQLLHEEPVTLSMGGPFLVGADVPDCGCHGRAVDGRLLDCDPRNALGLLARINGWVGLEGIGAAAAAAGFVADIDATGGRIVLHD